jgi:hypothetical protein
MDDSAPGSTKPKRRRGDVPTAIASYMREHPTADYFTMLNDLHAQGYRINRHGNTELMRLWRAAREESGGGSRRPRLPRKP